MYTVLFIAMLIAMTIVSIMPAPDPELIDFEEGAVRNNA